MSSTPSQPGDSATTRPSVCVSCVDPSIIEPAYALLEKCLKPDDDPDPELRGRLADVDVLVENLQIGVEEDDSKRPFDGIITTGLTEPLFDGLFQAGSLTIATPEAQGVSDLVSRAVDTLEKEMGENGQWILDPGSSTENGSQLIPAEKLKLNYMKNNAFFLPPLPLVGGKRARELVVVLGLSRSEKERKQVIANVVTYVEELIRTIGSPLWNDVKSMEGTETIVPPRSLPQLPPFPDYQFPKHGDAVLLVIPTENKFKMDLLKSTFEGKAPAGKQVHVFNTPVDSKVGEQPYNDAGALGAYNRVHNALCSLRSEENQGMLEKLKIGTVMAASIENFIQTEDVSRPTDFGAVIVRNATTGQTQTAVSRGTTVNPAYVERAKRFGSDSDPNYGRVTVGQILAANVPGLDKANWHAVVTGTSRYDLLTEAVQGMEIPW